MYLLVPHWQLGLHECRDGGFWDLWSLWFMKFMDIFIYRKSNTLIYFIDTYITELNIHNYTIIANSCTLQGWTSYYVSRALISLHRPCCFSNFFFFRYYNCVISLPVLLQRICKTFCGRLVRLFSNISSHCNTALIKLHSKVDHATVVTKHLAKVTLFLQCGSMSSVASILPCLVSWCHRKWGFPNSGSHGD